ncbi:MAG: preprotein translocase subunit SecE [Kiritimatiellae bacterium]|nr:preprotein translocase subunit SecE [Kiritimatiellia bacterium]
MKFIINGFGKFRTFLEEVQIELKKCAWPTRQELHESTIVVIISMVMLGVFVGASDTLFMWLLAWVF